VKKKYQVTYDKTTNDCFEVHKKGTKCLFSPSKKELLYLIVNNDDTTALATTVEDKINKYTV